MTVPISARVVAIVGPSGVGKDSLIAGMAAADPTLVPLRRVVTRPSDGTEPFQSATDTDFDAMVTGGAFLLHWGAHSLRYGVPRAEVAALGADQTGLVNLSRTVLANAAADISDFSVLSVSAPAEVLAARLVDRGREDAAAIAARLARPRPAPPPGIPVTQIDNGGALDQAVGAALSALAR